MERWDGTAWGLVSSPNVDAGHLGAVEAVPANDVWAVGYYSNEAKGQSVEQLLVERWDGSA